MHGGYCSSHIAHQINVTVTAGEHEEDYQGNGGDYFTILYGFCRLLITATGNCGADVGGRCNASSPLTADGGPTLGAGGLLGQPRSDTRAVEHVTTRLQPKHTRNRID